MQEIWKPVPDFEGYYEVSNTGIVRSVDRTIQSPSGKIYRLKGKIRKPTDNGNGYKLVILYGGSNGRKNFYIHRLVAELFIPNPDNLPQVNHKDEDKSNNNADNLEWCTCLYNINYGTGKQRRRENTKILVGEDNPMFGKRHSEEAKKKMSLAHKNDKDNTNRLRRNGMLKAKVVQKLSLDGSDVITEYESIKAAARDINGDDGFISRVCRGLQKSAYGFKWRTKEPTIP